MVTEYRKASAEALGLEIIFGRVVVRDKKGNNISNQWNAYGDWEPEKDANQMLMVWEWLIEQECFLNIDKWGDTSPWRFTAATEKGLNKGGDNDIKLATMKAFMEFIKH